MEISKYVNNDQTVFQLNGRLNATTAPTLEAELKLVLESSKKIKLDFKNLVYVSSAGLRILMVAEKISKKTGVEFTITNVSPEIMKIFEMTMISSYLKIIQE